MSGTQAGVGQGRMPSLDGIRGISIGLVILSHVYDTAGFPFDSRYLAYFDLGNLGVRVFFVISGFLITTLLLHEYRKSGTVDLARFYLRRTLRIFPAYYVFLATMALAGAAGLFRIDHFDLLKAVTYTSNYSYLMDGQEWLSYPFGHTWSLAVEEQFYLLWPLTLVLLGVRRGFVALAIFFAMKPFLRVFAYHVPAWQPGLGLSFELAAGPIVVGCLLAGFRDRLWRSAEYRWLLTSRWLLLVPFLCLFIDRLRSHPMLFYGVGTVVMNVSIALVVDRYVRFPGGAVGRLLNWKPLMTVGVMSYSLYLWQQPFLTGTNAHVLGRFPLNLPAAVLCAFLSYRYVEQPLLALRPALEAKLLGWRSGTQTGVATRAVG